MTNSAENNKRIAKNTILLYLRTIFLMLITLYTSRIILNILGVEDFGIYNIVGGVVVLFTFINSAMTTGTQRHLSYELGKVEHGNITEVFSACMNIHIWLAIAVFILAETIGLWFLNTQMNFPTQRMPVVNWVYQFSILSCITNIIRVPYQASIIAYERMSFYAYIGIIEATLKLAIVYILVVFSIDKLMLYSVLSFIVIIIITIWSIFFCHKSFKPIRLKKVHNKQLYKKMVSFSGWAMFGSVANLGIHQGINIIINIFYGVILNAAVGIANQVNSAVMTFVGSFQQALNPQLVKSQAEGDKTRQFELICESSKLSFLIMFIVAFPLMINLDFVLTLWLGSYPEHTAEICSLIIIGALIECLSGPLWVSIFATGNIKNYQIVISAILLLNVPISYIGGFYKMSPEGMFLTRNIIYIFALITRLIFLRKLISLNTNIFLKKVILPVLTVSCVVSLPTYALIKDLIEPSNSLPSFVWQTLTICIYELIIIYLLGLQRNERTYITNILKKKFKTHGNSKYL